MVEKKTNLKTAFAYHRYSTKNQEDGYSLEVQRNITKKIADKHDCNIIQVYEDKGISGATIDKRPSMLQLLDDLKTLKPNFILCIDQDRIARGNDFWFIKSLMAKTNTAFITEKEGLIDFGDITKDAFSDMLGVFAKFERGMITRRVKRAIAERVKGGKQIGNLKNILGYDYKNGNIVINSKEKQIILKIFNLAIEGKNYTHIVRYLNEDGYRTKHSALFNVKKIKNIIKNPIYCGHVKHYNKIYKGIHKAIISEEIFNKAQKNITYRKKYSPNRPPKYLLTGFLRCGYCGSSMGGYKSFKGYWNYRCLGYTRGICKTSVHLQKDKIEKFVIDKICQMLNEFDLDELNKRAIKMSNETEPTLDVDKKIKNIQSKLDRLLDEYLEGYIKKDKYRNYIEKLNKEINELKEINSVEYDYSILEKINTPEFFNSIELEDKRKIISLFLDKIVVYKMNKTRNLEDRIKCFWNEII